MTITFLGTGTSQGVPVIACNCTVCQSHDTRDRRLRTSALITTDDGSNILIDIGPDFREQMLREHVRHLEAILITHAHRDHVGGIDDIRSFNYVQGRKMEVYGNAEALHALQRDYHYIFEPHQFPGLPEANLHILTGNEPFQVPTLDTQLTVIPIRAMHKDLPVLGYRIGPLAYLTDANYIAPEEMQKMQGVDLLVVNALRKQKHFSHFCLSEALQVIRQVQPRRACLTHLSHEMGLHVEVSQELPENVSIAYDGLKLSL